ncbi:cyclic-phosphate processing receiver domain-containing protein [Thalassospira xianhensis]|uniref:Cyclic-phosphate processing Receiver domain-containing protein n=1 Tax=Thalassospira xianhensis MCCC 1A02616 TaxID=1177929 RepID=A0A367UDA3_9PROT|nr:cyclic-phosphate processing receiver domain-containing protein [Thalassospira xianhensis]RCK06297.1 hypothetical protein TH5_08815 [Thalassospira xianhensis MCCC 1A02616]
MTYSLFIDDERFPVDDKAIIVRSVEAAIAYVRENGAPRHVSFDNDLGPGKREGWEFARWLVEYDLDLRRLPEDFTFSVHSQNCVRGPYIEGTLNRYLCDRQSDFTD